jgi:release factor glutamine methyltransferase
MSITASYTGTIKARNNKIKNINIQNFVFRYTDSDDRVFHPHPISLMMANKIKVDEDDVVLDLCTGSGIFAITAAMLGAKKVIAVDISPYALEVAKNNALLNNIPTGKIEFIQSDYFSQLENIKFSKIFTNPPCMPVTEKSIIGNEFFKRAVDGGRDGSIFYKKVIEESSFFLKENGELLIPVPKWSNWKSIIDLLNKYYNWIVEAEEPVMFYLPQYDFSLKNHIIDLNNKGIVETFIKDNELFSNVLILKCLKK